MKRSRMGNVLRSCSWLVLCCACSGGSGNGNGDESVPALAITNQMSFVEAQASTANSSIATAKGLKALVAKALTTDTSTPYFTDPLEVWVHDSSMDSLKIINEILCSFDQTGYTLMVNRGDYIALVDGGACDKAGGGAAEEQGNRSAAANADQLEVWVVNSARANSNSPQVVKAWIPNNGDDHAPDMIIQAKMTISAGKSDANPFGLFHLDFRFVDVETESQLLGQGYLETVARIDGQREFQFSLTGSDDFPAQFSAHAIISGDGSSGHASTEAEHMDDEHEGMQTFSVAYDADHYLAQGDDKRCLDRKNFDNRVFRYGLYHEDGSRVDLNGGFGIKLGEEFGWAGYWGVWIDHDVTLTGGETVVRASNDDSSGESYTVMVAPGRLMKNVRQQITLGDLSGDRLNYQLPNNPNPTIVVWNGSQFLQVASVSRADDGSQVLTNIPGTPPLTITANQWLGFWREGLGNLDLIVPASYPSTPLTNATTVVLHEQVIMGPSHADLASGSLTLYCYDRCLKPGITNAEFNEENGASAYFPDATSVSQPYIYSIRASDMALTYQGQVVKTKDGVTASPDNPNSWGIGMWGMVASTASLRNPWEVWQGDYYSWETGPNQENHFSALLDASGQAVSFDPPLHCDYTHVATGDQYVLEYAGNGELHDIPWVKDDSGRWSPEISIPDGTEVSCDGTPDYVRALQMEQSMQSVDQRECSRLTIEQLALPPENYVDPAIGQRPVLDADPAIVKGERAGT